MEHRKNQPPLYHLSYRHGSEADDGILLQVQWEVLTTSQLYLQTLESGKKEENFEIVRMNSFVSYNTKKRKLPKHKTKLL